MIDYGIMAALGVVVGAAINAYYQHRDYIKHTNINSELRNQIANQEAIISIKSVLMMDKDRQLASEQDAANKRIEVLTAQLDSLQIFNNGQPCLYRHGSLRIPKPDDSNDVELRMRVQTISFSVTTTTSSAAKGEEFEWMYKQELTRVAQDIGLRLLELYPPIRLPRSLENMKTVPFATEIPILVPVKE